MDARIASSEVFFADLFDFDNSEQAECHIALLLLWKA